MVQSKSVVMYISVIITTMAIESHQSGENDIQFTNLRKRQHIHDNIFKDRTNCTDRNNTAPPLEQ